MAILGLGEGLLLGRGLELCFGIGQYRLIMLFGALGGAGIGLIAWVGRVVWNQSRQSGWRLAIAGGRRRPCWSSWFISSGASCR